MKSWTATLPLLLFGTQLAAAADDRIHGRVFLDDPLSAAAQSAPFWFFGRSLGREPCYPEGATNAQGDGPNPGTDVPYSMEPGEDCTDPGPWNGRFTKGNNFPTYWTARHCEAKNGKPRRWQITYSLYFVHDGMLGNGHKHDWEWISVGWSQCDEANDMWCRYSVRRSFHSDHGRVDLWDDGRSINGPWEIDHNDDFGKHHPVVYVGAFKHAMFGNRKTSTNVIGADDLEFRSNDWWWFADENLVEGNTILREWDYGRAGSTPMVMYDRICDWSSE